MIIIWIHHEVYGTLSTLNEIPADDADLDINNSQSFKYKAALVGKTKNYNYGKSLVKDTKIVGSLKYLSNIW